MLTIKRLHKAENAPMGDLVTYRVLPNRGIDYVDPFLFLNHHGPQVYPAQNAGLPFGPHPHRGMETVTFILDGDIAHRDSGGHESVIDAGGVQWMRAGRGLIHEEVSSADFKANGGPLEILQLWINLPASAKMSAPHYEGLQSDELPLLTADDGNVRAQLVFGAWRGIHGAFESEIGLHLALVHFQPGSTFSISVPKGQNVFFYVVRGTLLANGTEVNALHLAEFDQGGGELRMVAPDGDSVLLLGYAKPLGEPVVAQGPFVMNTEQEIAEAYDDYHKGKFGVWQG